MPMTFSCGCTLDSYEDGVHVQFRDYTCDAIEGFNRCVVSAYYCMTCAERVSGHEETIHSEAEADEWLSGKD